MSLGLSLTIVKMSTLQMVKGQPGTSLSVRFFFGSGGGRGGGGGGLGRGRVLVHYERFHSREQQLCKFIGIKESFFLNKRKAQLPQDWFHRNMVDLTFCENAL